MNGDVSCETLVCNGLGTIYGSVTLTKGIISGSGAIHGLIQAYI
ncbi:hypothetical protein A374_07659 [Fictibacillus macauensis ZFHKF-1]|uniref:Uncharacterized protein n=1 Tax=Fictibacillus macauensis ZFHKF-1 TaxID=1196324 RepID=I8UFM4_9BACL|nr:hypothetical protein A374_07659 [Fictibacillus macauensis ZFHKF-1]